MFDYALRPGASHEEYVEFARHQTTAEWGGYRMFDGTYSHMQQIPEEFASWLVRLQELATTGQVLRPSRFLEIGFATGATNTVLNKIFDFKSIVAVDSLEAEVSAAAFKAGLRFKNLALICRSSQDEETASVVRTLGPYDLAFIDGDHSYMGARTDFVTYKEMVEPGGLVVLHNIADHTEVHMLWAEIVEGRFGPLEVETFVCEKWPMRAGIGLVRIPRD